MEWISASASVAAMRFARVPMIIENIDDLHFFCPIHVGDRTIIRAQVNRAFENTIEVGARLDRLTLSGERCHGLSAYILFKTADGKDVDAQLVPLSEDEHRRWAQALGRKRLRLQRRSVHSLGSGPPLWTKESSLELIYSNIRALLVVNNTSTFGASSSKWEMIRPAPSPGDDQAIHMWLQQSKTNTSYTCLRVTARLPISAVDLFNFMLDLSLRRAWDLTSLGAEVVQRIDAENDICWFKLRSRPPHKPQDYILLRSWRVMRNPVSLSGFLFFSFAYLLPTYVSFFLCLAIAFILSTNYTLDFIFLSINLYYLCKYVSVYIYTHL